MFDGLFRGSFTTVRKPDAMPLMVADFMAFTYGKMRSSGTAPQDFQEGGTKIWRKEAGRAGLTHILLPAEGLARLKDNFAALQVARKENWREKKRSRQQAQSR